MEVLSTSTTNFQTLTFSSPIIVVLSALIEHLKDLANHLFKFTLKWKTAEIVRFTYLPSIKIMTKIIGDNNVVLDNFGPTFYHVI